jgi:tetratricopeptide (TPR) repeat protein
MENFYISSYNFVMKKIILTLLLPFFILYGSAYAQEQTQEEMDATSQEARVMYAQNEIDQALKLLQTKGEAFRSAEDWLLIGNILQDKDKLDEAIYMYKQAIEKDPKYYKAHYNLGYIYLIQEKPNMALEEFKKSVKYKDDFAYGYYNMGCAYLKLKQYRNARYNFFRAMDVKSDEPMIYYNLAYTFKKLNKEKQAQNYLDIYNKLIERQ